MRWMFMGVVVFALSVTFSVTDKNVIADIDHIDVRSTLVGTGVYLADAYEGNADLLSEEVRVGHHIITMQEGSHRISHQFTSEPAETSTLEGRFQEGGILDLKKVASGEVEKMPAGHMEQSKSEPKKGITTLTGRRERKNPEKKRRDVHVNVIRVTFTESSSSPYVSPTSKINSRVVTNFSDSESSTGRILRSNEGQLLCVSGSCERDWTGRFFYIDETGKRDAFLIRWKDFIITGATLFGNGRQILDVCLNGECRSFDRAGEKGVQKTVDRYIIKFTEKSFSIRRADVLKEFADDEREVPDF
jgi:hypothetical protein